MAVVMICLLLATVNCVFGVKISDMNLSNSKLLKRLEALENNFESQRLQIADLMLKDNAKSDRITDLEKVIADLTRQCKENTNLKPQEEGTEIDNGLGVWDHHNITKRYANQPANGDSDWGHSNIVKRSADVGRLPLQQRSFPGTSLIVSQIHW